MIDEIVDDKPFGKSGTEIETHKSVEFLNYLQKTENGDVIILDGIMV